jgi:predicted MFS family arabinose efflux permease
VALNPTVPFVIAGLITILAAILTIVYLPETNSHMGEVEKSKLFDFPKLWHTLFDPGVGVTFLISLVFFLAFSCSLIYGFQPFTMEILHVTESQNALLFMVFGTVGIIAQNFFVGRVSKKFGMKKSFSIGMLLTAVSFIIIYFSRSLSVFILAIVILALFNSIVQTLIPTILSQEADEKSQGSIMGLNASYQSIGMILGPLLGGAVATISISSTFLVGSLLIVICFFLSFRVFRHGLPKESAF